MGQFWLGYIAGIISTIMVVALIIKWAHWKARQLNSSELKSGLDTYYKSVGVMQDDPMDKWKEFRDKEQ